VAGGEELGGCGSRYESEFKAPTICFPCIDLSKIKGKGFKHFINCLKLFIKDPTVPANDHLMSYTHLCEPEWASAQF
jgi:hypothetical protein